MSQFCLLSLLPSVKLVLFVSILKNLLTPFYVSFKNGDQRLNLKNTHDITSIVIFIFSLKRVTPENYHFSFKP